LNVAEHLLHLAQNGRDEVLGDEGTNLGDIFQQSSGSLNCLGINRPARKVVVKDV
jgi:hypothetical protein